MVGKEKGKNLLTTIYQDFLNGISILSSSFTEGFSKMISNYILLIKYTLFTILLSMAYILLANIPYYTIIIPLSLLILMFHYEFLQVKLVDKKRLAMNILALSLILSVIYLLFSTSVDAQSAASSGALNYTSSIVVQNENQLNASAEQTTTSKLNILGILASSLTILLLALFLFIPTYMVKAGASPIRSIKNAFTFVSKNPMKTMTYIFVLIMLQSIISALASIIGLLFLSPLLFVFLSYGIFIFIYAFWEKCH